MEGVKKNRADRQMPLNRPRLQGGTKSAKEIMQCKLMLVLLLFYCYSTTSINRSALAPAL